MAIESNVTLGDIVNAAGFMMAGIGFVYTMYYRTKGVEGGIALVNKRLDGVDQELQKQTSILVQLAEQRTRIKGLEDRIDELFRQERLLEMRMRQMGE